MTEAIPSYDSCCAAGERGKFTGIKVVHQIDEIMKVFALRAAVFMAEQKCPFDEEFDGNDFSATHLIGYRDGEPIACIRVRCFAEFAKLERLAVHHSYRHTRIGFQIVEAAIELARMKGYVRIYGHAQERLVRFWSHFGAMPRPDRPPFAFSDFRYVEMLLITPPQPGYISLEDDPYKLIRPEGQWHRAGVLEDSAQRPCTAPLRDLKAA